jgi:hypothetical protein
MPEKKGEIMKHSIVVLSVAVTLLCAFLLFEENREVAAARAKIAAAEREQARLAAAAADRENENARLQVRLRDSKLSTLQSSVATDDLRRQLAAARASGNKPRTVSDLFKDQLMVDALKAEAREGSAKNIEAMFDDGLAEQLHLTADQSAALKQLLMQKMSILSERMFVPMVTGQLDPSQMPQEGAAIKQALADNAAEIRSLLGDDGYKNYQSFDQTQDERETVRNYANQVAEVGIGLTADQESQLMNLMTDERTAFRMQNDLGDPDKMDFQNWYDNFSDDKIAAYGQGLGQVNDRIIQQAQGILTPDQLAQFKALLAQEALRGTMVVESTKALMPEPGQ